MNRFSRQAIIRNDQVTRYVIIKGFRDLCENVWKYGKLDLRNLPHITTENIIQFNKMFGSAIEEVVYPTNITNQVLCHLPNAKHFTFYTELGWTPITRPTIGFTNKINLIVNGSLRSNLADPRIEISLTFPYMDYLSLNDIYFTRASIAVLSTTRTKNIALKNRSLSSGIDSQFMQTLLDWQNASKSIKIKHNNNLVWQDVILSLAQKIQVFTKLNYVTISMQLNWRNVNKLKNIIKSTSLQRVHIIKKT